MENNNEKMPLENEENIEKNAESAPSQKKLDPKIIIAIAAAVAVVIAIVLTVVLIPKGNGGSSGNNPGGGNTSDENEVDEGIVYSEGLEFSSNGDGTCTLTGIGSCTDSNIYIPRKSPAGDKVVAIGNRAFMDQSNIKSVFIHKNITFIDSEAFKNCDIERVEITDMNAWLEIEFDGQSSNPVCGGADLCLNGELVTEIDLSGCKAIGDYAFSNYSKLESIVIPDGVRKIGRYAFENCTSL